MSELDQHPFKRSVTKSHDAEREGAQSQASLATEVLNALGVGVVSWTADGKCSLVNHPALSILGMSENRLHLDMTLEDYFKEEHLRGAQSQAKMRETLDLFALQRPFQYTLYLPSEDIVQGDVRPLRGGGHVVTLTNQTEANQAITSANAALLEAEAQKAAATQILNEERARQREASLLAQMDEWLQSCKTLTELFEILTAFMKMALPGTDGQLFIYSPSRDALELACSWNCDEAQEQVSPDSCWALRRGRRYIYNPDGFNFACDHVKEMAGSNPIETPFTCVPVIAHGDTVGLLHIGQITPDATPEVLDPFRFARNCAEHISLAIANVQLRDELQDQSTRDPLTSLYNRRFFLEAMRRAISRAAAQEGSFGLLSFDADHFKSFNDKYGHDAGDAVLEQIADRMRDLDFPDAVPCRVGGEEFAVILPGADRTRAKAAAEDLRIAIEDMNVQYIGGRLPKVTVSMGLAIYPTHGTEPIDLIKQADLGLYAAKEAGRNCLRMNDATNIVTFN